VESHRCCAAHALLLPLHLSVIFRIGNKNAKRFCKLKRQQYPLTPHGQITNTLQQLAQQLVEGRLQLAYQLKIFSYLVGLQDNFKFTGNMRG
jgi:hypothetical protein